MTTTLVRSLTQALQDIVGKPYVLTEARDSQLYEYDATFGRYSPAAVVFPTTTEQVAAVVKACAADGVPFIARGSGTSLSGGPVPILGGVVISLTRMDRILELDYENQRAVVQPGVINQDLLSTLEKRGYFYAPDPASQASCTIGGNVGENSGGPHCLKYGVTTNHILGLETVLPDGSVLRTGGKALDWPGFDLTGLQVGGEGTFGIATEITCRIMPLPEAVTTMLAIYDTLGDATQSVSDIIAAGIIPATLEMMDQPLMHAVQMAFDAGYPEDAAAVLIIEIDGLEAGQQAQIDHILEVCRRNHARDFRWAKDENERALLWRGRKGAFGAVANISPNKLSTDITVPRTELPVVLTEVMRLGEKHNLRVGNVFHAGDGNLHPQILYDSRDAEQFERVKALDDEICQLAVSHGGTLSGEHGIGHQKRKFMPLLFAPQDMHVLWRAKDAFDPHGLCNPGKVLPDKLDIPAWEAPRLPAGSFAEVAPRVTVCGDNGDWRPADYEAAAKLLSLAGREAQPLVITGSRTTLGIIADSVQRVSSHNLDRVIDFRHENLSITVQAGTLLSTVQALCAERGQFLPLSPAFADRVTIGGLLACNATGPHRWLYGTPRDMTIGLRFALSTGEIVRIGGECVKNVAGYPLDKLMIGSRGRLGMILEATIRTLPLPAVRATILVPASDVATLAAFAAELRASRLRPAACVAARTLGLPIPPLPGTDEAWQVAVAVHGTADEVAYCAKAVAGMAQRHGLTAELVDDAATDARLWQAVTDAQEAWATSLGRVVSVRAGVPASQSAAISGTLAERLRSLALPGHVVADLGSGLVFANIEISVADRSWEDAAEVVDRLSQECAALGGYATWSPNETFRHLQPREDSPAAELMHRLKAALDPAAVLPPV